MNIRTFDNETDFYDLDPPWAYENVNVFLRSFRLNDSLEEIREGLDRVNEISEMVVHEEPLDSRMISEFGSSVRQLMRAIEEILYCFPELPSDEDWVTSFWQTVAGAYWRANKGEFSDNPRQANHYIEDIASYVTDGPVEDPVQKLYLYLENRGNIGEVEHRYADEFEEDIYESRDLIALGYYSTALLVLGRAVEKGLLIAGQERLIEQVKYHGSFRDWEDVSFKFRARAMADTDRPDDSGKMISEKEHLLTKLLINYRNNVAHTEYEDISRKEAIRHAENALDLLDVLSSLIEELREMDDERIDPIRVNIRD